MSRNPVHHQDMDFGTYITSIDWPIAIALAAILVGGGLILLRFLLATTSEVGQMMPGARGAAGRALRDGRGQAPQSWVCTTCRSVNTPHASHCYRGCGEREVLAEPLPTDRSLVAEGHNGRRAR